MEISRTLWWRFFQARTPAFFASLSAIVLFFVALHVASNSPATSITFSPRILSTSTSSSFYSITSTDTHQSPSTPSGRTVVSSDITLLKDISTLSDAERNENSISNRYEFLLSCDIFNGNWIIDDANPIYKPGSCPFIDDAFNCIPNGRLDSDYQRLRWQPKGCQIPRLDGKEMLETLRGKRLVFVGDSLNRNMWQSLGCILREALEDKSRMFEISGKRDFKKEGFYAFRFQDYNCTVEFVRAPFLVQESKIKDSKGAHKKTLRLDVIEESTTKYRDADIIIFNSGHWWNHEKTYRGKNYYQEGDHLYPVLSVVDAYTKGLRTWARWVDDNIDSARTRIFFRGYSPSHYRGGQWNSGGNCDGETRPIRNDGYLSRYPHMMSILERVIEEMRTPVTFLNITRMTDYRKDGHPSIFRHPSPVTDTSSSSSSSTTRWIQDCSHWCLPGVPDAWNQLLYTMLLTPRSYHSVSDH